ncbi:nucleoid-associated protein YejK [Vibrio parahaemolyticus]|uniref:Nucleoid-associated protein YejK n=6 Tax=Vibrio TaxID=662 RepID=A0A8H9JW12_VIBPH|nr:nucleoid-associated protein YejK [Vibrio parahaemolyticus]TOE36298.1 nucleoid-associated protein YejK [Vibrio parahaemolyticus]TOG42207.1 nucleoid-associated protein YejK [Vibrio parahaemolyticus]TOI03853.1 nucleoid-associated protein YejK [Vibrio parahaemolyticus]TOL61882.1 nucleoid-associated protein YejK [Vibrio parahaemolyticus]
MMTMTFTVKNVVLHELRNEDGEELQLHLNNGKAPCGLNSELLVQQMNATFTSKSSNGFGYFDDEFADSDVACYAVDHLVKGDASFLAISIKLAEKLHEEFVKYPFVDSGVLVFAEYELLGAHYLMIGLVPKVHSLTASSELKLADVDYLDATHMTIAARIDINGFMETDVGEEARYVSFMRIGNKRRMNDFFIDFLGIDVATEAKVHSTVLAQALEDYFTESNTGDENRSMLERTAYAYCDGQIKLKEDISIKELSESISDGFEQNFADYVKEQGYDLDEEFRGDRGSLRRLVKIAGNGGGVSMSFDVQLLNERVFYDVETDTLTIKGTPPAMRDLMVRKAKQVKS